MIKCLTKHPKNVNRVIRAVRWLLFGEPRESGERITSFEQDAGLIRSAFRQAYGVDLFRDKLHWLEFIELWQNLPGGSRYEEILSIRARPLPVATKYNQKEREMLIRAKQQCALRMTETERSKKYNRDVANAFSGLMQIIPKEVKQNE